MIVRVDLTTGDWVTTQRYPYIFPEEWQCKHAGGVQIDSEKRVWVADTRKLFIFEGVETLERPE